MYIRRTQTRCNATGENYFTYRLVRSERICGKVKQVTLLNLGRHFAVDQSLWLALYVRIGGLLIGQASLIGEDLPTVLRAFRSGAATDRQQLKEHDIQGRRSSVRDILSVQRRVTASFRCADGRTLHVRKATRQKPELAAIYQALNLEPLPGGVHKTAV